MDPKQLDLVSTNVGALPIVRHVMDRIGVDRLLEAHLARRRLGRKPELEPSRALSIMIANILLSREPLYGVPAWAASFRSELFGLKRLDRKLLNDDRIGRALDRLFETGRTPTLMTAIVTKVVQEFEIELDQIHNDTTTVTFSGGYEGQKSPEQRNRPPLITFGHNKDHRPDLKQLLYSLTISSDGAVPVHYRCYDGNITDDQTHLDTWKIVRSIRGGSDFLYVADSKLCTRENMSFIDEQGGRFLTVLPRSRREDDDFRTYIQTNLVPWEEVWRKKSSRGKCHPDEVYRAVELDAVTAEGYRLVWYLSSVKREHDEGRRHKKILRARQRLEQLADRQGAHAFRTIERAEKAALAVLEEEGAKRWLDVLFTEEPRHELKQVEPGRPGRDTVYRKVDKGSRIVFHISENVEAIQTDAKCDGLFAMVTNERARSPKELLAAYKYQPFLEKRNEQIKSVLAVAPIFLKRPERIAGLLFLYFIAVLIFALIEREVRRGMKKGGLDSLPLYPEGRPCKNPTADGIMRAVEDIRRNDLLDDHRTVVRVFHDRVSDVGQQVLELLRIDRTLYGL